MRKFILLFILVMGITAQADDLKEDIKETGKSIKKTAKEVGHKTKEAAHEVGDGFKKGWRKLKSNAKTKDAAPAKDDSAKK